MSTPSRLPPERRSRVSGLAWIVRYSVGMSNPAVDRLRLAIEMADAGIVLMRQNLKRRFPHESEEQIDRRLSAWLRGADPANARAEAPAEARSSEDA